MCGTDNGDLSEAHKSAWVEMLFAYAKLIRECNRAMEEAGVVSIDTYEVLLVLEDSEHGAMRMSDLADAVIISRSGLTRLADRLESEGLVARASCPNDRRATHIVLTDHGRTERERAWPVFRGAISKYFASKISEAEAVTIAAAFRRMRDI